MVSGDRDWEMGDGKTVELPDLLSLHCFVDNGTAAAASDSFLVTTTIFFDDS